MSVQRNRKWNQFPKTEARNWHLFHLILLVKYSAQIQGGKARGAHLLMREMSKEFEPCFKNYCVIYLKMFLNLNYDSFLTYRLIKQEFLTLKYKGIF